RQLHLPGPPLPEPADAGAGEPLPLPPHRREHAHGADLPLGAGGSGECLAEGRAYRAARRTRFDRRTAALPPVHGAFRERLIPYAGGWAASVSSWTRRMSRGGDRKSTRLNSSHVKISYAVLCLKKKQT